MRTKTSVYDQMLRIQAEMSFPLEQPFFCTEQWRNATNILDFGCGNGLYARMLANQFPDKRFTCVERDPEMASIAAKHMNSQMNLINGSLSDLPADFQFDFMLTRLVMMHLPDRAPLYAWAAQHASPNASVLAIDAADQYFFLTPELPLFLGALNSLREDNRKRGGNRDLQNTIRIEWEQTGFTHISSLPLVVHSNLPATKERMYLYMLLTAELGLGSPLSPQILEELLFWVLHPASYVQYGLFGSLFTFGTRVT